MHSKPFIEMEGSPCIECLVRSTCSKWCRKLDYFLKELGVEQIYIKRCSNRHKFERPSGDLFYGLPNLCPHCEEFAGIEAARWIYMLKG
ncbi:MAG: hypothetical protein ACFFG0_00490 [Candidatus Thorarchaeota archaeon]